MSAEGLTGTGAYPAASEAVDPKETFMMEGSWVHYVGRRGVYAVTQTLSGQTLMQDRKAVELAAMALGIKLVREEKMQVRCGWCRNLIQAGALDPHGRESTGIHAECKPLLAGWNG